MYRACVYTEFLCELKYPLLVNLKKAIYQYWQTKEIIIYRPAARNLNIPLPLPGIETAKQAKLFGIDVTDTLSTAAYV